MIFHKQRGEARTVIAIKAVLRVGTFESEVMLTNASTGGVLAMLDNPPARGTRIELVVGAQVLPGQVRWRHSDRCGVALRDPVSVADLIDGGATPVCYVPPRRPFRSPAALLRAIVRH